jgi:hypothetical protein
MELNKERTNGRFAIMKFHYWYGTDVFQRVFKDWDFYNDAKNTTCYIFEKV